MRHETRRRLLTVATVVDISPLMRRIEFQSPDLNDVVSLSYDDHIEIMLPQPDGEMLMRDYTPRAFDTTRCVLTIDFALHANPGPVTARAAGARAGDTLAIGGPAVRRLFQTHLTGSCLSAMKPLCQQ